MKKMIVAVTALAAMAAIGIMAMIMIKEYE